jgi:hypothetical protein
MADVDGGMAFSRFMPFEHMLFEVICRSGSQQRDTQPM